MYLLHLPGFHVTTHPLRFSSYLSSHFSVFCRFLFYHVPPTSCSYWSFLGPFSFWRYSFSLGKPFFPMSSATNHMQMGFNFNLQYQLLLTSKPICPAVYWVFPGVQHIQSWDPHLPLKTWSSSFPPISMDVTPSTKCWNQKTGNRPRFPFLSQTLHPNHQVLTTSPWNLS